MLDQGVVKLLIAGAVVLLLLRAWQNQHGAYGGFGPAAYNQYGAEEFEPEAEGYEDGMGDGMDMNMGDADGMDMSGDMGDMGDMSGDMAEGYHGATDDGAGGFEHYADWSAESAPMAVDTSQMTPPSLSASLLPKGGAEAGSWAEFAPKQQMPGQNFLDASKYIGINTVGNSLRNSSYDIRGSIVIPRQEVGPWQQSTIDPDLMRKPLQ